MDDRLTDRAFWARPVRRVASRSDWQDAEDSLRSAYLRLVKYRADHDDEIGSAASVGDAVLRGRRALGASAASAASAQDRVPVSTGNTSLASALQQVA